MAPDDTYRYDKQPVYTTSNGCPVESSRKYQRIGNGPILLQDFHLIDLLAHFDRERIPERVVHAKGAGAYGEVSTPPSEPPNHVETYTNNPHPTPTVRSHPRHQRHHLRRHAKRNRQENPPPSPLLDSRR